MRVAIIGSRTILPYRQQLIQQTLRREYPKASAIISGGADGADSLAPAIAKELGLPITYYGAQWQRYGRAAGPKRNVLIEQHAEAALAVIDKPLPESKGTANTVGLFRASGKPVHLLELTEPIQVVNCHWQACDFYCGRRWKGYPDSVLRNRDRVGDSRGNAIELYRCWLWQKILAHDSDVLNELRVILDNSKARPVKLGCWCSPKPCHCGVIVAALNSERVLAILDEYMPF